MQVHVDRIQKFSSTVEKNLTQKITVFVCLQKTIENERYIEIWNIVFSRFNAIPAVPLSTQRITTQKLDTAMVLERVVAVIQEAPTNFETDLFMPIINEVEKLPGKNYNQANDNMAAKCVDHMRPLSFAIGDALLETKVVAIIVVFLRRASMHRTTNLGINQLILN